MSIIAPAVAATHVPATHVGDTPAAHGMDYESVTLTTADGVALAAWYLEGSNGAGVVVVHGAGSTRSDVLDQSAVLVDSGYAVLAIDSRGHGDSHGTAMDFGWYGDLDIAAGTAFLGARPGIDPGRIGVVGFSMRGEEAIGAAATDPRIRAMVAEGPPHAGPQTRIGSRRPTVCVAGSRSSWSVPKMASPASSPMPPRPSRFDQRCTAHKTLVSS